MYLNEINHVTDIVVTFSRAPSSTLSRLWVMRPSASDARSRFMSAFWLAGGAAQ